MGLEPTGQGYGALPAPAPHQVVDRPQMGIGQLDRYELTYRIPIE